MASQPPRAPTWPNRTPRSIRGRRLDLGAQDLPHGGSAARRLYPGYADPAKLVELGDAWLASHKDADNALQRIVRGNVEASHRTLKVRDFNAAL